MILVEELKSAEHVGKTFYNFINMYHLFAYDTFLRSERIGAPTGVFSRNSMQY